MTIHVETDRYILRDIEETDVQGIYDLDSDADVHEFLGKKPIQTMEQAEKIITYIRGQYTKNGIGRWAIEDKETGNFVGWTGLKYEENLRNFSYYDLGYRLQKQYWGQGIATETAIASLRYGFDQMNLKEIGGAAEVMHGASNHILQKVGLLFTETFEFEGDTCNFYKLKREEWEGQVN